MSKLAERIRRASRLQASPIGFGAAQAGREPTLVLAASARNAGELRALAEAGADVVVVGSARSPAHADRVDGQGALAGAWIAGKADDEAKSYREAGFDFVVFDAQSASATALLDEDVGYVLQVGGDLADAELRALEGFQLDALLVSPVDGTFTVRRQIELRRIFALARKPLMAPVPGSASAGALQALRDTNVAVVLAGGADDAARLRGTIDALPPRTRRRDADDRPTPLVPRASLVDGDEHQHEDDEE